MLGADHTTRRKEAKIKYEVSIRLIWIVTGGSTGLAHESRAKPEDRGAKRRAWVERKWVTPPAPTRVLGDAVGSLGAFESKLWGLRA